MDNNLDVRLAVWGSDDGRGKLDCNVTYLETYLSYNLGGTVNVVDHTLDGKIIKNGFRSPPFDPFEITQGFLLVRIRYHFKFISETDKAERGFGLHARA